MLIKRSQNKLTALLLLIFFSLFDKNIVVAQDCKSEVEIVTNNSAALIFIDNVFVGNEKIATELEKGNHPLLIKEKSFRWNPKIVKDTLRIIECGKKYFFNYDLKSAELSSDQTKNYTYIPTTRPESFFNSSAFKILLGSAAVLGGVAAYFKIKADKKYDEYLQNRNQTALDEVNRLDLYSGISFGLLQINFGYLIYKFLTE